MTSRERRRQDSKDQRRLERIQKLRQQNTRRPAPPVGKRPAPAGPTFATPGRPARMRLPAWWPWAAAGIALAAILGILFGFDVFGLRTPLPGAKVASQGNAHVNVGDTHQAYSTDPPASGPHFPTVPQRGTYTTPFVSEYLPHFLEHAGIEIQYNSSASQAVKDKLTSIAEKELNYSIGQVLLAPRPDMPCEVALTAWQRIETFGTSDKCKAQPGDVGHDFDPKSSADAGKVTTFIERNMCQYDPENQCVGGAHGALTYPTPKPGEATVTASLGTSTPVPGTPVPQAGGTPPATGTPAR